MHCGFNISNWRTPYDFIPIFMISVTLFNFIDSALEPRLDYYYFAVKAVACVVVGFIFDYTSSKVFLISSYLIGLVTGLFGYFPGLVSSSLQVFTITYICELVIDNCKFLALSEIIALEIVSRSLGSILSPHSDSNLQCFFPATCLVLMTINLALFKEVSKTHRPLFASAGDLTVIPRPFGVFICFLITLTGDSHLILVKPLLKPSISWILDPICLVLVPLWYYLVLKFFRFRKISHVLLCVLISEILLWHGVLWEPTVIVSAIGAILLSAYCRCAGFVILSRVLGPYYNGKFFGFCLSFQYIFKIFVIEDWVMIYLIGLGLSLVSIVCLAPGMKYCEYHKDYVIGHTNFDGNSGKASKYKLKLQRASILET